MALVAICLGYFMVILDATVVNVALPALRGDLGATVSDLQWIADAYTLMFAAVLLTGGALGDRLGARAVFTAGLAVFIAASAACGAAPSVGFLVGARLAQGVGAALLVPASLALLQATYRDRAARARAVGARSSGAPRAPCCRSPCSAARASRAARSWGCSSTSASTASSS